MVFGDDQGWSGSNGMLANGARPNWCVHLAECSVMVWPSCSLGITCSSTSASIYIITISLIFIYGIKSPTSGLIVSRRCIAGSGAFNLRSGNWFKSFGFLCLLRSIYDLIDSSRGNWLLVFWGKGMLVAGASFGMDNGNYNKVEHSDKI